MQTYDDKAHINSYDDGGPNLNLCLEAQTYYKERQCVTRVKAAGLLNTGEAKQLAGVDSMTIAPELLRTLSETHEAEISVTNSSIFEGEKKVSGQKIEVHSFVNEEVKYREAFAKRNGGKGEWKTQEVRPFIALSSVEAANMIFKAIKTFCEYQVLAEGLLRDINVTLPTQ